MILSSWRRTALAVAVHANIAVGQRTIAIAFMVILMTMALSTFASAKSRSLSGTVIYRERVALPPSAIVEVQLIDVSLADAPSRVLTRTTLLPRRQVPLRYSLRYDTARIRLNHNYSLRARITFNGKLLFTNKTSHSLSTEGLAGGRGGIGNTDILVKRISDGRGTGNLVDSARPDGHWLVEDIGGGGVIDRLQTVLEIAPDGMVTGRGGCNHITGQATITGDRIDFGRVASTNMACTPAVMHQEAKFLAALANARAWRIDPLRRKLVLLDAQSRAIVILTSMK